ncbi:MAG: hypothetical protein OHK93_001670 [Ramalina farinacea]|uniref:FAD-binding domain-containing protein n=1 Tax=Ramalina farinacea TaxID=258253 RepID=A0AA43QQ09_9LECA|nr:hypothetical protein [Ramalina farinacea]
MPLNVIVVGAGIAGLCAAVALHQAGHNVIVFEKSKFAAEIGAALVLSPNGSRVLRQLGFSFERARGCRITAWDTLDGATLTKLKSLDLANAEEHFGAPLVTMHRVDLHKELLRLASEPTSSGKRRVDLRLNSRVVRADAEKGTVELADGSVHTADLVVAADGLHSVVKEAVLGSQIPTPRDSGCSAFRFLIPTKQLTRDPELAMTVRDKCRGPTILADLTDGVVDRHIVWYDCQGLVVSCSPWRSTLIARRGDVQNFVGILPNRPEDKKEGKSTH